MKLSNFNKGCKRSIFYTTIMRSTQKNIMFFPLFIFLFVVQSCLLTPSTYSQSIVTSLPGYPDKIPFKLETGYVGVGENEQVQLFYYFVESERNPENDPLIFYLPGGPGSSSLLTFLYELGPFTTNIDNGPENLTLSLNQNSLTKMANVIFIDNPAGAGFSYATTKNGWISSDTIMVSQATEFLKKFLVKHPKFMKNPLYIAGISYMGIIVPAITLELYNGNERGDQPTLNIQGYILYSPLTDKFMDFNSRLEYAHRMALISDDIYKSAIQNCHGNYVNVDTTNLLCASSLKRYEECTSRINMDYILDPVGGENDPVPSYLGNYSNPLEIWANKEVVQQALNIRQGTIGGTFELTNYTLHYVENKNDTFFYSYDIFSTVPYHKKLVSKNCRALVISGDHDMTFPYVGMEQWIASLDMKLEVPWAPFYVDKQVGGYEMTYAQSKFSLTFATIKGSGHLIPVFKPKESMDVVNRWLDSRTYSSHSYM